MLFFYLLSSALAFKYEQTVCKMNNIMNNRMQDAFTSSYLIGSLASLTSYIKFKQQDAKVGSKSLLHTK